MFRRILFLASLLSLALCLATVVLWVRSNWLEDQCTWIRRVPNTAPNHHDMVEWSFSTGGGRIWGSFSTLWLIDDSKNGGLWKFFEGRPGFSHNQSSAYGRYLDDSPYYHWFAFRDHTWDKGRNIDFQFPIGLVTISSAVLPLMWLIPKLRRRHPRTCCGICAYNLTGNTSGVCPECGTAIGKKVTG